MGQYWKAVNLDKHEYIAPHALGAGAKLGEQLGTHVGSALIVLCAAMPQRRGGGDFDLDSNFYGPERTNEHPTGAPVVEKYNEIAKRTIGRWAGDSIALVGDYAEDTDLDPKHNASTIYGMCNDTGEIDGAWTNVTADVAAVIEHECGGTFQGDGWRDFVSTRN